VNEREDEFASWRQYPAINSLVTRLETENSNVRGLEALLRSAFEAGWIGGFNHIRERSLN
jgi:hypothetical protein